MNSPSLNWRRYPERYNLMGNKCILCEKIYFPSKLNCLKCGSKELVKELLPHRGKIISFTRVHAGSGGFENFGPYYLGIVELVNGKKILSQILGDECQIRIGAEVKKTFRILSNPDDKSIIQYGYKFELIDIDEVKL